MNIEEIERRFGDGSQINPESYREHVNELAEKAVATTEKWDTPCRDDEIKELVDEGLDLPWLRGPRNCLGILLSASNPNEAIREGCGDLITLDYSNTWDCALSEMAHRVLLRDVSKAISDKLELTEARAKLKAAGFHVTE